MEAVVRVELDGGWLLPTNAINPGYTSMLHRCDDGIHLCRKIVSPSDLTVQFFCNVCNEKAPEYAIGFFELIRWET